MRSPTKHVLGSVIAAMPLSSGVAACGAGSSTSASSTTTAAAPSTVATGPGVGRPPVILGTKNFTEGIHPRAALRPGPPGQGLQGHADEQPGRLRSRRAQAGQRHGRRLPEYARDDSLGPRPSDESAGQRERGLPAGGQLRARTWRDPACHGAGRAPDVLATKPANAARHRLRSLADLTRLASSVTLAAPPEFRTRFNGLVGLRQVYGVGTVRFVPVKIGKQYRALETGQAQVDRGS